MEYYVNKWHFSRLKYQELKGNSIMKKAISIILSMVLLASCLFLSACNSKEVSSQGDILSQSTDDQIIDEAVPPVKFPIEEESTPKPETEPATPSDEATETEPTTKESILKIFEKAMMEIRSDVQMNVSGIEWQYGAENDLRNLYYSVLDEHPELKYAYDVEISVSGDNASCKFLYMPYKTGAYVDRVPAGSHTVASLHDAVVMAQSMVDGTERLPIAITDPSLAVEDIQRALAQAGYGWIKYDLSRDGTEIIAQPASGKTLDDCVAGINESFRIGGEILADITTSDMTKQEKAAAIYDYIVGNVTYDFRYYTDNANMPFESTVAIGALRDDLAICGGYAQAFETLLTMSGIENYTVSGTSKDEYHMWNYVVLDGVGYYCDPTVDRGGMRNHFMLSAEDLTTLGGYSWDHDFLIRISQR